jgi:succinate dehydrogenase flavin-adding protein (antitoxin of CptAB toxin-antitoxin module)
MRRISLLFLFVFLILGGQTFAQTVRIKGQVFHPEDPTFNLLIVNKSKGKGVFGTQDGKFEITADKADTILVGALGYQTTKICMADSADQAIYRVKIYLRNISVNLKTVQVFPERELETIQEDIRKLGYDDRDYVLTGIDAMTSPLTYLYQQVSRAERMKRRAYEIINEDQKRMLLKELFGKYVDYNIIQLDETEFDDFIDFMNVSDAHLKAMTQYEFVLFTKERFSIYRQIPPVLRQDIDTHD